jgi:CopG family nickel-responsive transcriptional regulator
VRTSLNLLIKEKSKINQVKGNIESVLLILHEKKSEQKILDVFHENNSLIHMRTHNCLSNSKCLETLIVKGDSKKIYELLKKLQKCKPSYLDLITP